MFEAPLDLADARILITNDDGVHATGLAVLETIARGFSDDVWVVAPEAEQSGASHSLTLRRPLRSRALGERRYAVDGTPTDCVLMALGHILKDHPPDLVLSGVNRGANLGDDVTYSGTIAAAMEGTMLGVPSIALSQLYADGERTNWATAETHASEVIRRATSVAWPRNVFVNVNFPAIAPDRVEGIHVVELGRRKLGGQLVERFDPRGYPYYWIGPMRTEEEGQGRTDIVVVREGGIAVTPVCLELTDLASMKSLGEAF
jgi:5'-nucleotidase